MSIIDIFIDFYVERMSTKVLIISLLSIMSIFTSNSSEKKNIYYIKYIYIYREKVFLSIDSIKLFIA
jgi:hypothetical protein